MSHKRFAPALAAILLASAPISASHAQATIHDAATVQEGAYTVEPYTPPVLFTLPHLAFPPGSAASFSSSAENLSPNQVRSGSILMNWTSSLRRSRTLRPREPRWRSW